MLLRATPGAAPRRRRASRLAVLLFYGELAGGGASVSRAITAACVFLGGAHAGSPRAGAECAGRRGRRSGSRLSPLAPFDAGFILSFGATLGILLGAPRAVAPRSIRWRRPRAAASAYAPDDRPDRACRRGAIVPRPCAPSSRLRRSRACALLAHHVGGADPELRWRSR